MPLPRAKPEHRTVAVDSQKWVPPLPVVVVRVDSHGVTLAESARGVDLALTRRVVERSHAHSIITLRRRE